MKDYVFSLQVQIFFLECGYRFIKRVVTEIEKDKIDTPVSIDAIPRNKRTESTVRSSNGFRTKSATKSARVVCVVRARGGSRIARRRRMEPGFD